MRMKITKKMVKMFANMISEYCNKRECTECWFANKGETECLFTTSPNHWDVKIEMLEKLQEESND